MSDQYTAIMWTHLQGAIGQLQAQVARVEQGLWSNREHFTHLQERSDGKMDDMHRDLRSLDRKLDGLRVRTGSSLSALVSLWPPILAVMMMLLGLLGLASPETIKAVLGSAK